MKNKSSVTGFLVSLALCVIVMFFYFKNIQKEHHYIIDNPLSKNLKITLNSTEYSVGKNQQVIAKIKKGKNTIKEQTLALDTIFEVKDVNGLINPTKSEYVIYSKFYGYSKNKDSLQNTLEEKIIDGEKFKGEITTTNAIYIEGFYYGLSEDFPKIIKEQETLQARKKIFRKEDFIRYYKNHIQ